MLPGEHKPLLTVKGRIHKKGRICIRHCNLVKHTYPCTKKSLDLGCLFSTLDTKGMQRMHHTPSNLPSLFHIVNANIRCKAIHIHRLVHLPEQKTSKSLPVLFRKASSSEEESWESKQMLKDKVHCKYSHLLQMTAVKTKIKF